MTMVRSVVGFEFDARAKTPLSFQLSFHPIEKIGHAKFESTSSFYWLESCKEKA
jgi:hypothetical protein